LINASLYENNMDMLAKNQLAANDQQEITMPSSEPLLKFNQVSKSFGRSKVLQGITLDIHPHDRIALVGSNGAGKTTLFRCLLGEYKHEGEILFDGLHPRQNRQAVLSKIGFVPQLPPPLKMPVGQLIKFAADVCESDPAEMLAVIDALGLDYNKISRQAFNKLSGGQKQKLLISMALGRPTELLVMDEPAANLDPEARHVLFKELAKRAGDVAMIISSHRLDEVATLVNRVIEMDQGKIVLDDVVADSLSMSAMLNCTVELTREEPSFGKVMLEWGFAANSGNLIWRGQVASPDRLRFLGVLSRYSGVMAGINMEQG
jgi:ABC-2 type transport system ATP-binding protein